MNSHASVSPTDNQVMQKITDGEIQLLQILFRKYHRFLNAFFLNQGCDISTAQDLTQETFLRILKARDTFKAHYTFKSWMFRIARNCHIDHFRRSSRRIETNYVSPEERLKTKEASQQSELTDWENNDQLREALSRLSPEQREILFLARFEQLNYREIARITGHSENNVKVRVFRALNKLRDHFNQLSERIPV